jgi:hypothetical protein
MSNGKSIAQQIKSAATPGTYVKLQDIKEALGLSQEELEAGVNHLNDTDAAEIEPESHRRRARGLASVVIGGEPRHLIKV